MPLDVQERVVRWAFAKANHGYNTALDGVEVDDLDFERSTVDFETVDDGYCHTCSYEYTAVVLNAVMKDGSASKSVRVQSATDISLPSIIEEMMNL